MNRREFAKRLALAGVAWLAATRVDSAAGKHLAFRYIVGSSMYGELPLGEILPDVRKTGAEWIDIWPRIHGNQREQMEAMGHEAFRAQLTQHRVKLGCLTHYKLGPFRLQAEMKVAGTFHCPLIICGGSGPKGLKGATLKAAVREFTEKMKAHLAVAEENDVSIGIENHANNLIDSPDSLRGESHGKKRRQGRASADADDPFAADGTCRLAAAPSNLPVKYRIRAKLEPGNADSIPVNGYSDFMCNCPGDLAPFARTSVKFAFFFRLSHFLCQVLS